MNSMFSVFLDAPHGHYEMAFDHVRVPLANMILGKLKSRKLERGNQVSF